MEAKLILEAIKAKESKITNAEKGNYVTDGQFKFSKEGGYTDIKSCRSKATLHEILVFLGMRKTGQEFASKITGISDGTWMGATIDQWVSDVTIRLTYLNLANEKQELLEMKSELFRQFPELERDEKMEEMKKKLGLA